MKARWVKQEGRAAEIRIEDNGTGFPESVLESLKTEEDIVTEKGTRIGIRNCITRLALIYGTAAYVRFENREEGGARVVIRLPIPESVESA